MNTVCYLKSSHPQDIIGQVFVEEGHSYRIEKLTKTWGTFPVFLAQAEFVNEKGEVVNRILSVRPNLHATDESNSWTLKVGQFTP